MSNKAERESPAEEVTRLREALSESERNSRLLVDSIPGPLQDVTEHKVAEEALNSARSELAHVARLTTLSTLTASIAHEVNQPLSGIITNAGTCLRMLNADPPNIDGARETVRRTMRDGHRAACMLARP